jgi:NDP-sugar pyrophosphorylase family protein
VIPALVLTAGLATRLRPLSRVRAKASLPVAGEPLVRRILGQLARSGVTDAVLNLHHLPHTITGIVGDGADIGVRVRYSWEDPVLGSAGGPRRALPLLAHSPFLIVNGDTLTDVDVGALLDAHRAAGAVLTLAVVRNTMPQKYGGLAVHDGVVTGFVARGAAAPSFHFLGVQIAESAAFAQLPDGAPAEFRQVVAAHPGQVRAHVLPTAQFFDIGTPADYLETSLSFCRREQRSPHAVSARIASSARVIDSVLWDGAVVEDEALVRECVVCDGAVVPAQTAWHGVSIRQAAGELDPGEKRIGDLAIAAL